MMVHSKLSIPDCLTIQENKRLELLELKLADVSSITLLAEQVSDFPWSEKDFQSSISNSHICVGVKHCQQWIGYAVFSLAADEAELLILGILPEWQRKGIASSLLNTMAKCLSSEAAMLFLEVRQSNHKAIAFYEKLDFHCVGERPNYYPCVSGREHALIYGRHL